jgi:very-short-patch-repair endonuclease
MQSCTFDRGYPVAVPEARMMTRPPPAASTDESLHDGCEAPAGSPRSLSPPRMATPRRPPHHRSMNDAPGNPGNDSMGGSRDGRAALPGVLSGRCNDAGAAIAAGRSYGEARAPAENRARSFARARRRDTDATIAAIAAKQHGVVARRQLVEAGITEGSIERRVWLDQLHAIHRGVYRVGPLPLPRSREMAAVLVGGDTARLSHRSAGLAQCIFDRQPDGIIDITAARNRRVPAWIRLHRVSLLPQDEVTSLDGIPITTPARTLLDLAATVAPADVEQALIEVVRRRLTDAARIRELLERYPRRRGASLLRELLARLENASLTRSEAERLLRSIVRQAEVRMPRWNVIVEGYQVDAIWPDERVIVEVDGFVVHSSRTAFERDRRRDAHFAAAGFVVIRFTWHQLRHRPMAVAARLAATLATAQWRVAAQRR